jgi:hypothetical protein
MSMRSERSIYHSQHSGSLLENRILDLSQRTEPGIDGLARTNLRFS